MALAASRFALECQTVPLRSHQTPV